MKKSVIFGLVIVLALGFCFSGVTMAISETQEVAIIERCDTIKDDLKKIQRLDARTRVFIGSHYEAIISKFVIPLNLRLVENNLSDVALIESQNELVAAKSKFASEFISYQQGLEELIAIDCKAEPEKFYNTLVSVREKREKTTLNVLKMRELLKKNITLTEGLKGRIK